MSKQMIFYGLVLVVGLGTAPASAQILRFDFEPFTPGIQDTTTVSAGQAVEVNIVMTDIDDLLGYSTDVLFNADLLDLMDVRENPGDLNFDSQVDGLELNDVISFFIDNALNPPGLPLWDADDPDNPDVFEDHLGHRSGILLDLDGDEILSGPELNRLIFQFISDVRDSQGTSERVLYWTDLLFNRGGVEANESVEIADPPSKSNLPSTQAGEILDITAVLLARPNDKGVGYGYDTSVYGDAVLVTLRFQAKTSGAAILSFRDPVYILETFQNIETDVLNASGVDGTITIQ